MAESGGGGGGGGFSGSLTGWTPGGSGGPSQESAVRLLPTRPDTEVAAEIKEKARLALECACDIATEARAAGFWLQIGMNVDQFGRFQPSYNVVKHF